MDVSGLCEWIMNSPRTVVFGGAGVSTESGIPDFRSENGIFKALEKYGRSPETLLSHTFFELRPDVFFRYYRENLLVTDAEPNGAHYGLAELERRGKLSAVVTQNIDGLHQKAGMCWSCTVRSGGTAASAAERLTGSRPFGIRRGSRAADAGE